MADILIDWFLSFIFSSRKSGTSSAMKYDQRSGGGGSEPPIAMVDFDGGQTAVEFSPTSKEMAVDVPPSFVGRTKTPPRYPPPKSKEIGGSSPIHHNNNNHSGKKSTGGGATPINGTLSKPVPTPKVPTLAPQSPPTSDEMNIIKKYEVSIL